MLFNYEMLSLSQWTCHHLSERNSKSVSDSDQSLPRISQWFRPSDQSKPSINYISLLKNHPLDSPQMCPHQCIAMSGVPELILWKYCNQDIQF